MNELVSIQEIYDIIHECSKHRCSSCAFYSECNCLFDEDPMDWDLEQIHIALNYIRTRSDYKKGE